MDLEHIKQEIMSGKVHPETVKMAKKALLTRAQVNESNKNLANSMDYESQMVALQNKQLVQDWQKEDKYRESVQVEKWLYIDSSTRDLDAFPLSGHFEVELQGEVDNIAKVNLVQAKFPMTDPAIRPGNNTLRFSRNALDAPTLVSVIEIPTGSYKGEALALEITTQMNMDLFSAEILAGTHVMDFTDGLVYTTPGNLLEPLCVQCLFVSDRQMFLFRVLDGNADPTNTETLHLLIKPVVKNTGTWVSQVDDIWDILGYSRLEARRVGLPILFEGETYFFISSDVNTSAFGGGPDDLDIRYDYALRSSQASKTTSADYAMLCIDTLKDNDTVLVKDGPYNRQPISDIFGKIYFKDAAYTPEASIEINNMTFPCRKNYREGVSRVSRLNIRLYRPDGTIFSFGGRDWSMTLALIVKETSAPRATFARGGG